MQALKKTQQIFYILELIEKNRSPSVKELSLKFQCSERTIRRMILELKNEGHNIVYSKNKCGYVKL